MSLKNEILNIIRSLTNPIGYDIVKYKTTHPAHIVLSHLNINNINTILDVGANAGQYSLELRKAGYKGRIISFEPVREVYQQLLANAIKDSSWQTFQFALGDTNGKTSIHISGHSPSSSLLPMTSLHNDAAPGSEYLCEEEIEIRTLDAIFHELEISGKNVFLKVDTQGYEKKVLDGALDSLSGISGIQIELSSAELYKGEESYYSLCRFLEEKNFHLVRIIPGFSNKKTSEMLQFDAIFFRK